MQVEWGLCWIFSSMNAKTTVHTLQQSISRCKSPSTLKTLRAGVQYIRTSISA